jgi:hypothetical protein
VFDEPNLVSSAGLVPIVGLAESAGLGRLADEHVRLPTDKGANQGVKVTSLVAGMAAGADSIDDMALLRRDGPGLRARLRRLHVGVVPADVHLRPRPPTRRGGLEVPARVGRADPSARVGILHLWMGSSSCSRKCG